MPHGKHCKHRGRSGCRSKHKKGSSGQKRSNTDPKEYYVEQFNGKRLKNGRIEMLVKWLDHPPEESTWEPFMNLGNCLALLEQYEIQQLQIKEELSDHDSKSVRKYRTSNEETSRTQTHLSKFFHMSPLRVSPNSSEETVLFRRSPIKLTDQDSKSVRKCRTSNEETSRTQLYLSKLFHMSPLRVSPNSSEETVLFRTPIKVKKEISSDDEDVKPSCSHGRARPEWKVSPYKGVFGLARGLELDKVVHNFRVKDKLLLFVRWKGFSGTDVVPFNDLKKVYPQKVIEYFESMERRYK